MTGMSEQLPHLTAFPHALGTGLLLHTSDPVDNDLHARIGSLIDEYESALSRFRPDSPVSQMRMAEHGGTFDFPDQCAGLFDLYDRLFEATEGAIDPCVGEDLIRLGYDAKYSFAVSPDAFGYDSGESHTGNAPNPGRLGAIHGRPTWRNDVQRHGTTLVTYRPIALDFGACGKGYLVDLIAEILAPHTDAFVIDAGGDLLAHTTEPVTIALEDPADPNRAVGTAALSDGAFCASSPSRRHWGEVAGHALHHLLNAIDGLPVEDVAATWVDVKQFDGGVSHPTAIADGLATALFTTPAERLRRYFAFDCAILNADRTAARSPDFPGGFFTA
ncbi:FAD:protein FMN transferase [Bifidobacterium felsineum]|nr:FAD:protein FMN transferase [Bifidobacterium felsineum]